jgi:hypothetical protein
MWGDLLTMEVIIAGATLRREAYHITSGDRKGGNRFTLRHFMATCMLEKEKDDSARRLSPEAQNTGGISMDVSFAIPPRLIALMGLFAALNVGDLVSTWIDLHAGLHEGNPLMSQLLGSYGFGALIVYKIFVVSLVSGITLVLWSVRPRMVGMTLLACDVLVFGAIAVNVMQFPPLANIL